MIRQLAHINKILTTKKIFFSFKSITGINKIYPISNYCYQLLFACLRPLVLLWNAASSGMGEKTLMDSNFQESKSLIVHPVGAAVTSYMQKV